MPTVSGPDVAGPLGSTPVGSIPVGSIPVGSIPVGSIPVGSIAARSRLAQVSLADISPLADVVSCGVFVCTGKTLGDAAAAGAIVPGVTLAKLQADLSGAGLDLFDSLTIDELLAAMIPIED